MRGAPQVGFSIAIRKIKPRSSLLIGFLPLTCLARDSHLHTTEILPDAKPRRFSVLPSPAGFFHPDQTLRSAIQKSL
jgi:hypothetical protein